MLTNLRPRKVVELLSRDKVIKRNIIVNGTSWPILASPDAQLKYLKFWNHSFDNDLIKIAEQFLQLDHHVWDIGANVGVFTFAASSIARQGSVLAVEADIWLAGLLRKTSLLEQYRDRQISIVPAAISNSNSVAKFMIAERGRASNALEAGGGRTQMGGVRETQWVPTLTLDTIALEFPPPDFIKIDVEGAEMMVIEGARKIIEHIRPIFYVEVGENFSQAMLRIFHDAEYTAKDLDNNILSEKCASNTFFVPNETLVY